MAGRREYLAGLGLGVSALLAGCEYLDGTSTPTTGPATETATATTPVGEQVTKLVADDGDADDGFGFRLGLSGDGTRALLTAPDDEDPNGETDIGGAGSAYVFDRTNGEWEQSAKLVPDDGDPGDRFGWDGTISTDGETVIVGAVGAEADRGPWTGAAYVFVRNGGEWRQQAKLAPPVDHEVERFGAGVALTDDGTVALVGAPGAVIDGADDIGAAYVFERGSGGWSVVTRLTGTLTDSLDNFGDAVALSGDGTKALVGAPVPPREDASGGSVAYVFEETDGSWAERTTLEPENPDAGDQFGYAVALDRAGVTALVGAHNDEDPNGSAEWEPSNGEPQSAGAGSATVFTESQQGWTLQRTLAADDGDGGDYFGFSVSLAADGATALVGAVSDEDPNGRGDPVISGAGSAYLFTDDGEWTQRRKLAADDGDGFDGFGAAAALSSDGDRALVGAVGDEDPHGSEDEFRYWNGGSAYVFE